MNQVGGAHYDNKDKPQHWDLIDEFKVPYLEGTATKYLCRWKKKNGKEDLLKALHYVNKIFDLYSCKNGRMSRVNVPYLDVYEFLENSEITCVKTREAFSLLLRWKDDFDLRFTIRLIDGLIRDFNDEIIKPGTPEDGGQHARYEEKDI